MYYMSKGVETTVAAATCICKQKFDLRVKNLVPSRVLAMCAKALQISLSKTGFSLYSQNSESLIQVESRLRVGVCNQTIKLKCRVE